MHWTRAVMATETGRFASIPAGPGVVPASSSGKAAGPAWGGALWVRMDTAWGIAGMTGIAVAVILLVMRPKFILSRRHGLLTRSISHRRLCTWVAVVVVVIIAHEHLRAAYGTVVRPACAAAWRCCNSAFV